jgi:hypothetical protein
MKALPVMNLQRSFRRCLRQVGGPRVLTVPVLIDLAETIRPGVSRSTVAENTAKLTDDGDLIKVTRGLWLNHCLREPAPYAEAAPYIRRGAIVSLHTVLGDSGVLHNYTHNVHCVIPQSAGSTTSLEPFASDNGTSFEFIGMPEHMLAAPDPADMFAPVHYQRATNEAALCHYLFIYGKLPFDLDLDGFDMDRAGRIAEAMGISEAFQAWAEAANFDFDKMDGAPPSCF